MTIYNILFKKKEKTLKALFSMRPGVVLVLVPVGIQRQTEAETISIPFLSFSWAASAVASFFSLYGSFLLSFFCAPIRRASAEPASPPFVSGTEVLCRRRINDVYKRTKEKKEGRPRRPGADRKRKAAGTLRQTHFSTLADASPLFSQTWFLLDV